MHTLQAGVAKSGNYWLYRIIRSIFAASDYNHFSYIEQHPIQSIANTWQLSYPEQSRIDVMDIEPNGCFFRISSIFRMPIDDVQQYVDSCSLVWSHSEICERSNQILPLFNKIVYIIRDPRDIILSASRFSFTPYMLKYFPPIDKDPASFLERNLVSTIGGWVKHVGGHLKYGNAFGVHFVFYERLLSDFDAELTRLLKYLGIELVSSEMDEIAQIVAFSSMKQKSPHHVRKGESYGWSTQFSDAQMKQALRIGSPMLKLLGYPIEKTIVGSSLPSLPSQLTHSQIDGAIDHANRNLYLKRAVAWIRKRYFIL